MRRAPASTNRLRRKRFIALVLFPLTCKALLTRTCCRSRQQRLLKDTFLPLPRPLRRLHGLVLPSASQLASKQSPTDSQHETSSSRTSSSSSSTTSRNRPQGVYVRPSAAVERGSGFFIPGLQGFRLRLVAGSLGLVLAAWNHYDAEMTQTTGSAATSLAEIMAVAYSLLVLLQGAIESFRGNKIGGGTGVISATARKGRDIVENTVSTRQVWSTSITSDKTEDSPTRLLSAEWRKRVEWAAQTYMALTPARRIWLLSAKDGIIFRIEREEQVNETAISERRTESSESERTTDNKSASNLACQDAVKLIAQSSTGRISLPVTHPVSQALFDCNDRGRTRTVVLQRVDNDLCLCMTSSELLVAFRKQDLAWLGQLAKYIAK